jgi:hypothetical protein
MHTQRAFTASGFANWVFMKEVGVRRRPTTVRDSSHPGLYVQSDFDQEEIRKRLGYLAHYDIEEMRRSHFKPKWRVFDKALWSVDYCDTGDESEILSCSRLTHRLDGRKLRGKPDIVFVNESTSHAIIVERKTTNKSRDELLHGTSDPSTWPNCWAQLWAYAHLDRYEKFRALTLVFQPWHTDELGYLSMGHVIERDYSSGSSFDLENLRRFEAFGGVRATTREAD